LNLASYSKYSWKWLEVRSNQHKLEVIA